jgi:hypothetical protein
MTVENKEPVVFIDDKELKVADFTQEQQYLHTQIVDLKNQKARLQFQMDQVNASLSVFENKFIQTAKETADEVLETETKTLEN